MKKLSSFQKQCFGLLAMLLVAAVLYGIYILRPEDGGEEKTTSVFLTDEEQQALSAFEGEAVFTFKDTANTKEVDSLTLMVLALSYDEASDRISVVYGKGEEQMSLTVNGKKAELGELFLRFEDGTPYATTARAAINKTLFGDELDARAIALSGYDVDGDKVNAAGSAYLYGPVEREDIEGVYVKNSYGEMMFINDGSTFYLHGMEAMTSNTANIATLVANCRAPVAVKKINDIKDLADYGLETDTDALATVIVFTNDGGEYSMRIGKELPDNGGFYAYVEGKEIIYVLMDSVKNTVMLPKEQFVSADYGLQLGSENEVFDAIDNIAITFDNGEVLNAVKMTEEEADNHSLSYTWKIVGPDRFVHSDRGYALPDYMTLADVLNNLCALSSSEIVAADVTEEALKKYGLDKPHRVFAYDRISDETVRITVYASKPDVNGTLYVYSTKDDGEVKLTCGIGKISTTDMAYIEYEIVEYLDSYLYLEFIDFVDEMIFERGGETYRFVLGKNDELEVTSATLNGETRTVESVKKVYQGVLRCYIRGEYKLEKPLETDMTLTILNIYGNKTVFSFSRISAVKVHVTVNGGGNYYINYGDYETLLNTLSMVAAGKQVTE